jgi:hypothetical protein
LGERCTYRVHEQIIGTHMPKDAARRFADGGAGGGDDVGILQLFAHGGEFLIFNQSVSIIRRWRI